LEDVVEGRSVDEKSGLGYVTVVVTGIEFFVKCTAVLDWKKLKLERS
jgi:hypothetical protein